MTSRRVETTDAGTSPRSETPPARRPGRLRAFLRLVQFEHSVFALPFAYIAALTAMWQADRHVHWRQLGIVTVAMVAARTFAMAVNRIVDRHIDARNPRTRQRELVTGVVSVRAAGIGALSALAVLVVSAAALNRLCLYLSPVAAFVLAGYPYAKRITWAPHAVLGLAQTIGPIGAWIAVTGTWSWTAVLLGLAVGCWIGGFDIIYALQDYEFDRTVGIQSLPARFGPHIALAWSRVAHFATIALLLWFGAAAGLRIVWLVGVLAAAVALGYEQHLVKPSDFSKVNRAFFTVNGYIGVGLFLFGLGDLIAGGLRW
ncbi:4-hydroxybenzoate polyprenyltransferase, putative [Acidothermus cellulolyticus 11B]|uniref:4-hydroxybenzoate polyprenyltransferase n=1 Tax=Acidothermus cellulolyticus (strain ATCC 43068 / DSM 8971 / 11B) TaxID=351607 RepID=A0LRH0_ACIC1|nr:menaquinone biosynthesis prenyltransferase MqnP [Acidothermus cellulolyticus]ABK52030.1 4-hydroxybenzoate polyprenyltransferase, putative [Acidothermus cellulolyticus 11B]